ncbi:pH-response regulator protein palF/prr-3 [Podospora aff. communis PSN243]|uniref:PH-response regulator protein palF/prr-3 n=1 Tax=Podospora aff. communis PSN243 TaxID=3040156 RepID=A0AAV9H1C7_9PEZI|nr:pH-response regulator protein palF/prr-3 [Podospora aff. communis PSN243]
MGPYQKTADNSAAASAPASSSTTSVSLEEPSASRSFFSRFSLPLRSRARNVADFHIRPADPHRKYAAGDHVQGAVILTVVKPVRITHLTVSLHGYVRVYKSPNGSANEPAVNPAEVPSIIGRAARSKNTPHGYASLFQDEQVLSSDGRLEPGRYEFNFDLLFPAKGLPSSIDFERGTISYMITATLTRPTSITPTTSCERKIYLVEKVDIGPVPLPRSRTIYLEPISKRPKKKRPPGVERGPGSTTSETTPEPASDMDSTRANENSTEGSLSVVGEDTGQDATANNARSPVQSDVRSVSGESAASTGSGPTRAVEGNSAGVSSSSPGGTRQARSRERTITATIELLRGGCLAGDLVPVKISVQHIRRIKSMHGVIVTLYRQGRIDSAPVLPAVRELTKEEAKRLEKEEYYPKSKTGLGGLSLSSAGSCSVFRKDLSQAFTPLIIDPATLTASVTTSVRVPEDVFPTIKGVPGEMITFKYNIEVIVDLGGKLANQIQTSKPAGTRVGSTAAPLLVGNPYEAGAATLASWSTSIIDTDRLRREKGVISVVFELVVGTLDTSRMRGKSQLKLTPSIRSQTIAGPENRIGGHEKGILRKPAEEDEYQFDGYPHDYAPLPPPPGEQYPPWDTAPSAPISAPFYVPPPEVPDDSALTEKDRIRRAEERLLPSQPPAAPVAGPSNPVVPSEENIYDADDHIPPPPPPGLLPPAEIMSQHEAEAPSAPTLEDLAPTAGASPTEDKQELERRRLLAEASAPPEFPEDYDNGGVGSSSSAAAGPSAPPLAAAAAFEPSAPVLVEEEDSYGPNFSYASMAGPSAPPQGAVAEPPVEQEPLPRYER